MPNETQRRLVKIQKEEIFLGPLCESERLTKEIHGVIVEATVSTSNARQGDLLSGQFTRVPACYVINVADLKEELICSSYTSKPIVNPAAIMEICNYLDNLDQETFIVPSDKGIVVEVPDNEV